MTDHRDTNSSSIPDLPGLPETVPSPDSLGSLFHEMADCTRCELALSRTRVVPGVGPASARVMLVGEAPGAREDQEGRPFVGRSGQWLDRVLARADVQRDDVFVTNLVACRPPGNRNPRPREVRAHAPWLEEQLRLVDPQLIVTLGGQALAYFVPGAKILQVHGAPQWIEREGRSIPLLPLAHPAAAGRFPGLGAKFEADIARIKELLKD